MGEVVTKILEGESLKKLSNPAASVFSIVEDLPSEKRIQEKKEDYYENLVKTDLGKKFSQRPGLITAEMLLGIKYDLIKIAANNDALEENDLLRTELEEVKGKNEALSKFTSQLQDEIKFQQEKREKEVAELKEILGEIAKSEPAEILARIVSKESNSKAEIKNLQEVVEKAKRVCGIKIEQEIV